MLAHSQEAETVTEDRPRAIYSSVSHKYRQEHSAGFGPCGRAKWASSPSIGRDVPCTLCLPQCMVTSLSPEYPVPPLPHDSTHRIAQHVLSGRQDANTQEASSSVRERINELLEAGTSNSSIPPMVSPRNVSEPVSVRSWPDRSIHSASPATPVPPQPSPNIRDVSELPFLRNPS